MIPYSRHRLFKEDIKAVNKVLKSDFLTTGPQVEIFEKKLKKVFLSKYVSCVNSATSALHLACLSMGLKKKDYLWTSSISFVASANCGLYCGASIGLVDIDLKTLNISVDDLSRKLEIAKKEKKLPKIIVVVHMAGNPCEMKEINILSKKYKFMIIEDASHASGSYYQKDIIGNCKYSDVCIFSLHPVKIFTSGEGGILLTNNKNIDKKVKLLRSHGIEKNPKKFKKKINQDWYYEQHLLGFNYRMSDIHAALGISQLKRVKEFTKERNKIIDFYKKKLNKLPIKFQSVKEKNYSSYHLNIILFKKNIRNKLFKILRLNNFFVNLHYIPIYKHPFYKKFGFKKSEFPNAEIFYESAISIPVYYGLEKKNILKLIDILKKFL